ncbi:MAG: CocE/NonD family hydrolase [bacterium]
MKMALALAALFALTAFAGCSGTDSTDSTPTAKVVPDLSILSKAQYAVKAPQEVWVSSSVDGKRLDNAVYLPDVADGTKVPVFINFSPYWGDSAMNKGDHFAQYMISEYVPRGYAVVLSAVRGTGHSEGCFQIGGDQELKDAYDVVDYFSKQPWSNGNVGAGGKSYDSTTQNGLIAKFPHPALKTLFHVSGITDMYRYNAKAGVVYNNGLTFNTMYGAGQGLDEYGLPGLGTHSDGTSNADEDQDSLARVIDDAACVELPKENASGAGTAADGMKDAYWQERDWVKFLPQSTWNGSIFFVHGLQDWNVKPDNIDPWVEELQAKHIQVKGWLHQETDNLGHLYPMRTDWNITMLRWLDWYLKGIDTGIQNELGFDVMGSDKVWRHDDTWPPAGRDLSIPSISPVPADGYTIAGLGNGTRIAGVPYVSIGASTTGPDPVLLAALYDVGEGKTTWLNDAVGRPALRADLSGPSGYVPGPVAVFNLTFYPMDYELKAGHSLKLVVGLDPTRQETQDMADFEYTPSQAAGTTYSMAVLHLPIISSGAVLSPQPIHMKCFAC